ncbi:hypothetical protein ABID22_000427 [Pontibacter aydingkolensis]|uniref:DUF4738 domain-containing protein n=1 Tax=Pontibacter aydingkolensis TaxID=1911536 RepID=A0ABS7CPY9_9BACT|nr:DUF4738 domain-containing protein [Pontibacter aydingkolensis]MBW7465909.1 DUF4738 domain-containing protein [Pontibacter aydingkolensis]
MNRKYSLSTLLILICLSCTSKKESGVGVSQAYSDERPATIDEKQQNSVKNIRREYWPLDHDVFKEDTTIHLQEEYLIKTYNYSLNDSAVIHTAIDDMGEFFVHSHNRVAEVTILQNQKPFIKSTLTKDIFDKNTELQLSGTSFQKFENGEFVFRVDACIPDTDVCDAAEVAVDKKGKVRVIKYLIDESEE